MQQKSVSPEQGRQERAGGRGRAWPLWCSSELCLCLQLLLDCSELESRLAETLRLVTSDDHGRSQQASHSLMTQHQVRRQPGANVTLV